MSERRTTPPFWSSAEGRMIALFDVLWLLVALPVYGTAALTGGCVLWWAGELLGWPWALVAAPLAYVGFLLGLVAITTVLARLLPKEKPGTCKVFADRQFFAFLMHWGLQSYVPPPLLTHIQLLTFLRIAYFRGHGASLSWSTHISPGARIWSPALCRFGDFCYIGEFAHVTGHLSRGDKMLIAPVEIGDHVNVGAHANISPGVTIGSNVLIGPLVDVAPGCLIEDGVELGPAVQLGMGVHVGKNAKVEPRSFLGSWTHVPDGEVWAGDPAKKIGEVRQPKGKRKASS